MPLKTVDIVEEATINLTPLVDIVFLLVIFFMVGTQFSEMERQYDIELPTVTDAQPLTGRPDELVLNVSREGVIVLRGETLTLVQLESALREAKRKYADQSVVIRGQGDGRYQHVMDVLSICNQAKINNISLANRLQIEDE